MHGARFLTSLIVFRPACWLVLALFSAGHAEAQWWSAQQSGLETNLRGVSVSRPVLGGDAVTVWAVGSNGVILRSVDRGENWARVHVAGGEALDFRGIVSWDVGTAYLMSSGDGEKSRIYKTTDSGETWALQYTDKRKEFFLDALVCLSAKKCYALADPIDGKFLLLATKDGEHWEVLPNCNMPAAVKGEGAFAASNSALSVNDSREIFFGTGGPVARVFRSLNGGRTWSVAKTPVASGNASSGIFSVEHESGNSVVIAGGDYKDPSNPARVAAYSQDEGASWQLAAAGPAGYRSAVKSIDAATYVAVGPTGSDISRDGGVHWERLDAASLNAMSSLKQDAGWAVGPNGTICVERPRH